MNLVYWFQQHSILFMMLLFGGIALVAYLPSRKARADHDAMIPFDDDR